VTEVRWVRTGPGSTEAIARLLRAGYRHRRSVAHVDRALDAPLPLERGLASVTAADLGGGAFCRWLGGALADSPNRDLSRDPVVVLQELGERFAGAIDLGAWLAVSSGGVPIGVVMPQLLPDGTGTMAFVGVLRGARGRGMGARLHRLGLAALQERGVTRYRDMTDVTNHPMRRVFRENGCAPLPTVHHFERARLRYA
jgi:ribosomal protein S18 acetylase RimI-like enzyme